MSRRFKYLVRFSPFLIAAFVLWAYEYGPDPGYTGAPGDNPTGCNAMGCHTGVPNTTSGGSVQITASGGTTYVPGQTEQIQVTITDSTEHRYGFQLTARADNNPKLASAGTLNSSDPYTQVIDCKTPGVLPFAGSCPAGNTLQWIEHSLPGYQKSKAPGMTYTFNWTPPPTDVGPITLYAAGNAGSGALVVNLTHTYLTKLQLTSTTAGVPPNIFSGGIVPVSSTVGTIQPGEWVSIFGTNLASTRATWNGDFPTTLGGTSVTVNGKPAYLWFVDTGQINMQTPDDTATGLVSVTVTTPGGTTTSTVNLAPAAPSFLLLDNTHVTGIIQRADGSGIYGGGTYDIVGPTGSSLGFKTVAAKAGDSLVLFAVGFGPTKPAVPAGKPFSSAAPATSPVQVLINNTPITPAFAGLTGAGLYQINLTVPPGLGQGDMPLRAMVGGSPTQPNVVVSLQ